ncbi:hypothetical protein CSUI_004587, partial [Cystoisospora suis]
EIYLCCTPRKITATYRRNLYSPAARVLRAPTAPTAPAARTSSFLAPRPFFSAPLRAERKNGEEMIRGSRAIETL